MKPPLRIAIIMRGGQGWIGGAEYIKNLILALGGLPIEERSTFTLTLVTEKALDEDLSRQLSPCLDNIHVVSKPRNCQTFMERVRWAYMRRILKYDNPCLYEFLKRKKYDFVYPYFSRSNRHKYFFSAAWIPDFQHKYLEHFFTKEEIVKRDREFYEMATKAKVVVLSSDSAKQDFCAFYPGALAKPKVLQFRTYKNDIWYKQNPVNAQNLYNLPDRFFIICNQFWRHKNHIIVLEAMNLLKNKNIRPVIVCTGHVYDYRDPEYSDVILSTIHRMDLSGQIKLLGLIPRQDQIQLMRRSIAVIQPSLFEGWSTVVEDARVLGKKMLLSDFSVHVEQNPDGAVFFAKSSSEELANLMERMWGILPAGPDMKQEKLTFELNREACNCFAKTFLQIAKEKKYY